jgi:hypothetical protein
VSAQYGDLVSEHEDLDVVGCVGSGEWYQPAQHAGKQQIGTVGRPQRGDHAVRAAVRDREVGCPKALARCHDTVLGTHRVVSAQHGDSVTEHQDLGVLGCVGAGE